MTLFVYGLWKYFHLDNDTETVNKILNVVLLEICE